MTDRPLFDLNELMEYLRDHIVHTDQGSFVRVDDLKEAMNRRHDEAVANALRPRPRTFAQARRAVYQDEELMGMFDYDRNEAPPPPANSPSVSASETPPSSRT